MTDPGLSIVIPTYDTAAMTIGCCRAVLASMPDGCEVIVADDGSRDGTSERLAAELPAVKVVRLDANRGFATAANAGVAVSRGAVILLLNSDAVVEHGALRALLAAFDRDPKVGVAGAQLLEDDGTPQWSGGRTPTLPWMIGVVSGAGHLARLVRRRRAGAASPRPVDWVSGAAMAFRREVWSAAGPLSTRYRFYCQDIEFCLRARDAGWTIRIEPAFRVVHGLGRTVAEASALRHDPARMWPDLLTWGASYYGRRWAAFARLALIAAACLRITGRALRGFRRDGTTAALIRATRQLVQSDS